MRVNSRIVSSIVALLIFTAIVIVVMISFSGSEDIIYEIYLLSKTVKAPDESILMTVEIEYPQIISGSSKTMIEKFNMEFYNRARTDYDDIIDTFVDSMLEEFAVEGSVPFTPFTFSTSVEMTYSKNDIISVLYTDFQYAGGAHPNSWQYAYTYNIKNGDLLKPQDIMGITYNEIFVQVRQLFVEDIHNNQIREQTALRVIDEEYDAIKYYLDETGLVFYFDPYEIASYADGRRSVTVPFEVNVK
jgi:Protein of unknown function (DUF3298).